MEITNWVGVVFFIVCIAAVIILCIIDSNKTVKERTRPSMLRNDIDVLNNELIDLKKQLKNVDYQLRVVESFVYQEDNDEEKKE